MIEQFHFLRPEWLLALPALAALLWYLKQRGLDSGNWAAVIDPVLMPHVVSRHSGQRRDRLFWLFTGCAVLAIFALAGPTWEKQLQSVYRQPAALVVALDLSRSMDASDVRPSRLARARHKIADILRARKEGQSALVVYAADAFAVTPLTTDVDTILALLPDLETSLMPAQGTRADRAFEQALELFANSTVQRGDFLLVSDGVGDTEASALESLLQRHPGFRMSVLAVGSAAGGPIPRSNGGFFKDRNGEVVVARMNTDNMRGLAAIAGGVFVPISVDDADINRLTDAFDSGVDAGEARRSDATTELWRELGPNLLLLVLPLAALAFRRGLIWCLPFICLVLPPEAKAFDWQALWKNADQRALDRFRAGDVEGAAALFDDSDWKAAAQFRLGEFDAAANGWSSSENDTARYNHATALAEQGQYQEAIAAYNELLKRSPDHADARFNRDAIEEWLEQQTHQAGEQQSGEQDPGEQNAGQQSNQSDDSRQPTEEGQGDSGPGGGEQADNPSRNGGEEPPAQAGNDGSRQDSEQEAQSPESTQQAANGQQSEADTSADTDLASLEDQMSEQAAQQWLRKIPDDPGGLLRRKFIYQYRNRGGVDIEEQNW